MVEKEREGKQGKQESERKVRKGDERVLFKGVEGIRGKREEEREG